jgi:mannose-1-phosphate guanylyltransferase / phosphomannomutase
MRALLFADRPGQALLPLTERACVAMLPVVGKPLVVFAIEDLALAQIHEAFVVVGAHADLVKQELGEGSRWGIQLQYIQVFRDAIPEQVASELVGRLGERFLMMRGDVLRTQALMEFLALASEQEDSVEAIYGGQPAALRLARQIDQESWRLEGDPERACASSTALRQLELPAARISLIASLTEYYNANLDAAAGRYSNLILPGREIAPGIRLGRQSRLPSASIKGSNIFVGSRCRVDRSAELMDGVVVSDDVIVDRHSTLRSTVILPHTYIGEMVDVSDSIVSTNYLINAATCSVTRVVDAFLLSGLKRTDYTSGLGSALHRILGMLALLFSAPLWPLMLLASLISQPSRPFRRLTLVGNKIDREDGIERRRPFVTFESATSVPALKWLPLLLGVASGNLRMIGCEAMTPERTAALEAEWGQLREETPIGLIGPAWLSISHDAPDEEKRVVEGYYARSRTSWSDIALLGIALYALFRPSAWIATTENISAERRELRRA